MGSVESRHPNQHENFSPATSAKHNSGCPMASESGCPVNEHSFSKNSNVDFDPLTNMPKPDQNPAPDQPFPLRKEREKSTIPKAGTNDTWDYPSPQMFWNAMLRKGWRWQEDQLSEKDMENIIAIHNANNEEAWREILKWERMLHPLVTVLPSHGLLGIECDCPKLWSFKGDAQKITPRARFRHWIGYQLPYDRHDWIIDRCGREVHYVIDYYDGGNVDSESKLFTYLDVRPAMDSWRNIWDRAVVAYWRFKFEYLGIAPKLSNQVPQSSDD